MASTVNAFDLLKGAECTLQQKKKKRNKAKKAADTIPVAETVAEASSDEQIVEQAEACAVLEKSARTFKAGGDRVKLWKDWCRQANERNAKLKYRSADGSLIHFKEVVLRSRALEITIESCVTSPLTSEQTNSLQQLLSTFIPNVDSTALAASIAHLAQLLCEDTQSFDTTGAAQRAVHNVISSLKTAKAGVEPASKPASLQDRLTVIDREAGKQQGFLASVEKLNNNDPLKPRMPGQGSGISKAHVDSAKEIARLLGEKFDLLQPNSPAVASKAPSGSGPSQATIKCLEELKDIIGNHLKEARGIEESVKGAAMSKEAQRAQAVAALRREEAVLAQQAADIAGQIRSLESQLAQLKGQAAEVEDKRVRLQQRQAAALEALGATTGRKMSGLSAQHYNEELAVADQLLQLVDPSRVAVAADQLAAAQEEHGNAAGQYMAAVRNMLQMSSSSLADIPNKVVFCRQRIAQAEKLSSLGGVGKEKSAKTREEAEKLLADTVKHCEDILAAAQGALEGMRSRFPAFTPQQQAELSQAAYEIEDMMSHIRGQYELAMAAMRGQAPTPAVGAYGQASAVGGGPLPAPVTGGFGAPVTPAGALGPVVPPPTIGAPNSVVTSNGSHTPAPIAAPVAGPRAAAAAPTSAAADGFQQVGGKKNRRKA